MNAKRIVSPEVKSEMSKHKQVIVPEFYFSDGTIGVFIGFDRECCPQGPEQLSPWMLEMGVFDKDGNFFKMKIDRRKVSKSKKVTYLIDGKAHYHEITGFYDLDVKINPYTGHSYPHTACDQCDRTGWMPKIQGAHSGLVDALAHNVRMALNLYHSLSPRKRSRRKSTR